MQSTLFGDRILVVDDEPEIISLVSFHLDNAGYQPVGVGTGAEAVDVVRKVRVSLIVLDLLLPDMSGFEVLSEVRAMENIQQPPCLMLSALRDDVDRIRGLAVGADDYLTKPFNPDELVLRVNAILRRATMPRMQMDVEVVGPLTVDRRGRRVLVDGTDAGLTPTEYRLLTLMLSSPGLAQRREELLRIVWGAEPDMQTRTVDVHIQRLRTKLGKAGDLIETVRGFGYRVSAEKGYGG